MPVAQDSAANFEGSGVERLSLLVSRQLQINVALVIEGRQRVQVLLAKRFETDAHHLAIQWEGLVESS